jgi:hypothetical protein
MNLDMEKKCERQHHLDVFIEKYPRFGLSKWTFNYPFCYNVVCFYWVANVHMIMPN